MKCPRKGCICQTFYPVSLEYFDYGTTSMKTVKEYEKRGKSITPLDPGTHLHNQFTERQIFFAEHPGLQESLIRRAREMAEEEARKQEGSGTHHTASGDDEKEEKENADIAMVDWLYDTEEGSLEVCPFLRVAEECSADSLSEEAGQDHHEVLSGKDGGASI
jgi:hypothetical protein